MIFYPPADFWNSDSANHYFSQPLDSIKAFLHHDTIRPNRFLVRLHGVGCVLPELIRHDYFYRNGDIVDLKYRECDFSKKAKSWSCRFNLQTPLQEKLYLSDVEIMPRKYHNPGNFILGWLQMAVSLCVIGLILYVWVAFHSRQKPANPQPLGERLRQDAGVLFLAAALFFWAVIGLIRIESDNSAISDIMTRWFSLTNNALFLLALPYFRHGVSHFKKHSRTYLFAGVALVLTSLLILLSIAFSPDKYKDEFKWFDVCYSTAVLGLMGWLLIASFWKRNLPGIAVLAGVITLGAIYTQIIPHIPIYSFAAGLFRHVCYYTTFVMFTTLLVALTFSWYNEEMVNEVMDKFAQIQEVLLSKNLSNLEKNEALEKALGEDEIEVVFTGLDCARGEMDEMSLAHLVLLRNRYFSSRKEYHTGKIDHADFRKERIGVVDGLHNLIKSVLPKQEIQADRINL